MSTAMLFQWPPFVPRKSVLIVNLEVKMDEYAKRIEKEIAEVIGERMAKSPFGQSIVCSQLNLKWELEEMIKALSLGGYNAAPPSPSPDLKIVPILDLPAPLPLFARKEVKCECGAEKCGSPIHSNWCPRAKVKKLKDANDNEE
jgi:hypothetical protein